MSQSKSRLTLRVSLTLVALAIILAEPASLNAQKRKPIPSAGVKAPSADSSPGATPNYRTTEQAQLEMQILMSRRASVTEAERERRRMAGQLAQDLERLDQINTEQIAPLSAAASFDYKNLALASAEIRSRATRIKFYSPLELNNRSGAKIRYETDAAQLGALLPQLSRAIASFLDNPVFRVSAPNDSELRSKAAHDLDGIIKLSDTINKITKRLSKTTVASN